MSHEFLQELYEKEKRSYQKFPAILLNSKTNNYVSKRKLTQKTDKFFKSMSFANKQQEENHESQQLSIKNNAAKKKNSPRSEKKEAKTKKIQLVNHKSQHSFSEKKQMETRFESPFRTSYEDHYMRQHKIKWIPKRYGPNNLERNFSQNFYDHDFSQVVVDKPELSFSRNPEPVKIEDISSPPLTDRKNNEGEINRSNEGLNDINKDEETKNNPSNAASNNINCACDEVTIPILPSPNGSIESEALTKPQKTAPLSKTDYFKILNIGFQHLRSYSLPIERLNDIIKENEAYFRHLAGLCKCYKCTCGFHRCDLRVLKFSYSMPLQTSYMENYSQKTSSLYCSPIQRRDATKDSINSDCKASRDFAWASITKTDFVDPQRTYGKLIHERKPIEESPLLCKQSHYQVPFRFNRLIISEQREFLNFGISPVPPTKAPQQKTVINELPFYGLTTYNSKFLNFSGQNGRIDVNLPAIPNPLKSNTKQLELTTNQRDFRPYSIHHETTQFKLNDNSFSKNQVEKLSFPGQFKTTTSQDFLSLKREECPFSRIS